VGGVWARAMQIVPRKPRANVKAHPDGPSPRIADRFDDVNKLPEDVPRRVLGVLAWSLSLAATGYLVVFGDFGEGDNALADVACTKTFFFYKKID
jgi:hypothetical protein